MTTLTVNIENEEALSTVTGFLKTVNGVSYNVDEEHDEALEASIQRGLADIEAGRVRPHEEVWAEIEAKYRK